jgi:hypothetical protein
LGARPRGKGQLSAVAWPGVTGKARTSAYAAAAAPTRSRATTRDAYAYCKVCHPGAIERLWTWDRVLDAMCAWRELYGQLLTSYDWSRTHARASPWRRAARATEHRRLAFRRRRDRRVRELEGGTGCGRQADRPGWRRQSTGAGASFLTIHGQPGGRSSPIANAHDCARSGCADRIQGRKRCT